ncbi:two-component regulator propeller domain-containing protein [Hymenobacter psoromatis]|uniref:hybrid sensor histidine kinase/response regulator transcription factor n=1 Tax=Hymenobacter psoromatis TaxID=1484116 RepID=UPI001CBEE86C|nr:two-component regulator propeller domain-containing protein [Hymenobacter psoromatis]
MSAILYFLLARAQRAPGPRWAGLLAGGLWLLAVVAVAASLPPRPAAFRFEHLTVNQGLAHSDALAVAQDRAGFLWIGTNKGIDRYDGYELRHYALPVNPLNAMPANRVRVLHLGPDGTLWAGVESAGLSRYDADHNRFNFVDGPATPTSRLLAQATVVSIAGGPGGRLWVGTEIHGLFALRLDARGHLLALSRVPLPGPRPVLDYHARALALAPDGRLWIGTTGAGLLVLDTRAAAARPVALALGSTVIRALCLDRQGDLWVGTDHQVLWLPQAARHTTGRQPAWPLPYPYADIQSVLRDSFGRLWVGTTYGLHLWEAAAAVGGGPPLRLDRPTEFLPLDNDPTSINSDRVQQVFEDRDQVLWLAASAGGLNKVDLRQKPFFNLQRQVSAQPTLANNFVNAIYEEQARHRLWLGTRGGLSCYNLASRTYRNYLVPEQPGKSTGTDVSALLQTTDSALWVATINRGLWRLRFPHGQAKAELTPCPGGGTGYFESLAQDRFGTVWAASLRGLSRFGADGRLLRTYRDNALPTSQFTYLLYDRRTDVLWASTRNAGLLKLRVTPDSLVLLRQFQANPAGPTGLAVSFVWPLLLDAQGTLWIGTIGGGLHRLVRNAQGRETIERYHRWLPESDVESMLPDADGNLWIGGTGLYRFTPATRQYLRYDVADGLQSNAFKVGAAWAAPDGTLYFGGINGLTYFQPRAIQANPFAPVVQLTSLRLANKPVAVGEVVHGRVVLPKPLTSPQAIIIKAAENDFSIGFVALNYANPNKHRYAYRLVGYNPDWVPAAPGQRTASFANLPPGDYTFLVKASNGEGRWSAQPATLRITVLPPWWRTWWAYLLYGLAALSAVALYRRVEMAQQKLKNQLALEEYRVEKEKELTDLKISFFTNISHELRTPLTLILGPMEELVSHPEKLSQAGEKVALMHKQTRKLLDLVNQLLDFRRAEGGHIPLRVSHGDIVGFLTEIFLIFKLKAEEKGIAYTLEAPAEVIPLYFDRNKLEIVLTNLLANAFKYTEAGGRVRVAVAAVGDPAAPALRRKNKLLNNYLEIKVIDEGIGMAPDDLHRIFDPYFRVASAPNQPVPGTGIGLALVKQAMERHAGELEVASALGSGTTFTLRLPFGRAHLALSEIEATVPEDVLATAPPLAPTPSLVAEAPLLVPASPALLLIVEDNDEVRHYLHQLFTPDFEVALAADGVEGWEKTLVLLPDLVISDVMMPRRDGLALCRQIKEHPKTAHIPVMLLTARTAAMHELAGLETGADDYGGKPFNPQVLHAKALALLNNRGKLREYYQRQLLLEPTQLVIPDAEKQLLESAMRIVEANLDNPDFGVPMLVREMSMSQSVFYRRIKSITGQSVAEFIRDVRMKRAAQLLATAGLRVSEIAYQVGFEDAKHFREAFRKIYDLSPSEYAARHRPAVSKGPANGA